MTLSVGTFSAALVALSVCCGGGAVEPVAPPIVWVPAEYESTLLTKIESIKSERNLTTQEGAWVGCYSTDALVEGTLLCVSPDSGFVWHAQGDNGIGGFGDLSFDGTMMTLAPRSASRGNALLSEPLAFVTWERGQYLIPVSNIDGFCRSFLGASDDGLEQRVEGDYLRQDEEYFMQLSGEDRGLTKCIPDPPPPICSRKGA